jgi:hypothetical protein
MNYGSIFEVCSDYALWKSLIRRRDRLQELLEDFEKSKKSATKTFDFEEVGEMYAVGGLLEFV